MVSITCDLHVHTSASADGHCAVEDVLRHAKDAGLDAVAITDHDSVESAKKALALDSPVLVIPGIEVSTKQGHVLLLGTTEMFPKGEDALETIHKGREAGCLVIIPHPYHHFRHAVGLHSKQALIDADALEGYNSRYYTQGSNKKAVRTAKRLKKPVTAGSDAHDCRFVGYGINVIEARERSVDAVLNAIREGNITSRCIKTPAKTYTYQSYKNVMRKVKKVLRPKRTR
ncbi:MAG TPA: PHP domain-containing protein [Methanocorpusculum sp.]|nr:PHP domain-containing protein [Methanocorpusculum sp.]